MESTKSLVEKLKMSKNKSTINDKISLDSNLAESIEKEAKEELEVARTLNNIHVQGVNDQLASPTNLISWEDLKLHYLSPGNEFYNKIADNLEKVSIEPQSWFHFLLQAMSQVIKAEIDKSSRQYNISAKESLDKFRIKLLPVLDLITNISVTGLSFSSLTSEVYLMPVYRSPLSAFVFSTQISYKGYIKLIQNNTIYTKVLAYVVYAEDVFDLVIDERGKPHLKHQVNLQADNSQEKIIGAYCLLVPRDESEPIIEYSPRAVIDKDMLASKGERTTWKMYYPEMAKKNVIKKSIKKIGNISPVIAQFTHDDNESIAYNDIN